MSCMCTNKTADLLHKEAPSSVGENYLPLYALRLVLRVGGATVIVRPRLNQLSRDLELVLTEVWTKEGGANLKVYVDFWSQDSH